MPAYKEFRRQIDQVLELAGVKHDSHTVQLVHGVFEGLAAKTKTPLEFDNDFAILLQRIERAYE
jgi:hypothetical protein